jgi:carboxyl-terminal processing protease
VDEHRGEYLNNYDDFQSYNKEFTVGEAQLDSLVSYAEKEELAFVQEEWDISKGQIALLMKGYIARDLWGMAHFYEVYNQSDEVFRKAVEILEDPAKFKMKLARVD